MVKLYNLTQASVCGLVVSIGGGTFQTGGNEILLGDTGTQMEEPVLHDEGEYPSDDVLRRHLGRAMASWQALMAHIDQHDPALSGEWRYYKDGKSWLYKATRKKLTLCWVSVFRGRFKTTCYFPDRAEAAITGSKLAKTYIDQYLHGRRYGKTRAISVDVRKLADLKATKQIMEIRLLVK